MGSASPDTAAPWHALDVATSARRLATDLESGLTQADAERRLTSLGRNELEVAEGPSRLRILLSQFNDVLIWLLIGAAVVSGAFLSEWVDTGVIVAIVVLNAVLGYVQESRAEEALAALKELTAPQAMTRNQYRFADIMTDVLVYIAVLNLRTQRRDRYRLVHHLDPHRHPSAAPRRPHRRGAPGARPGWLWTRSIKHSAMGNRQWGNHRRPRDQAETSKTGSWEAGVGQLRRSSWISCETEPGWRTHPPVTIPTAVSGL